LSDTFKICPICGASNHRNAAICSTCGTTLSSVGTAGSSRTPATSRTPDYDFQYGETDLLEDNLRRLGQTYLAGILTFLVLIMFVGLALIIGPSILSRSGSGDGGEIGAPESVETPTRPSQLNFPTVTTGPPTLTPSITPPPTATVTPTPTRTPCMQEVRAGEGLYNVVLRCGHQSLDVIDLVLEINDIDDPLLVRPGDIIEVPWPTETPDPNAELTETASDATGETGNTGAESTGEVAANNFDDEDFDPFLVATPTLPAGVMFHQVVLGENIISIGLQYGANVEVLSQLNPEVSFAQCDFSLDFGGPRCNVQLIEGQQIRVPAPTPTATIPPTASGSETPTPTSTPTFNAPSAVSPSNRAFFRADQLVTLRWIGTATLGENQTYRLRVENVTDGIVYTVDSIQTSFVLPLEWQGTEDARFEFTWIVSVINTNDPDNPLFTTTERMFTWVGRE
jgi:hypothetical protein